MKDDEVAKTLYDEVKNGSLVFVPERDEMRKCVQAIREQREKASRSGPVPAQQPSDVEMLSSLYGNSPRAPQNLGNAQPFKYQPDAVSDDVQNIAARGVSEFHEAECFAQYERDLDLCNALAGTMGGIRGIALCKTQAFQNYQHCRGY
jgi:hypothetical protein